MLSHFESIDCVIVKGICLVIIIRLVSVTWFFATCKHFQMCIMQMFLKGSILCHRASDKHQTRRQITENIKKCKPTHSWLVRGKRKTFKGNNLSAFKYLWVRANFTIFYNGWWLGLATIDTQKSISWYIALTWVTN